MARKNVASGSAMAKKRGEEGNGDGNDGLGKGHGRGKGKGKGKERRKGTNPAAVQAPALPTAWARRMVERSGGKAIGHAKAHKGGFAEIGNEEQVWKEVFEALDPKHSGTVHGNDLLQVSPPLNL